MQDEPAGWCSVDLERRGNQIAEYSFGSQYHYIFWASSYSTQIHTDMVVLN